MKLCKQNERMIYGMICVCASSIAVEIVSELVNFTENVSLKISRLSTKTGVTEKKRVTRSPTYAFLKLTFSY